MRTLLNILDGKVLLALTFLYFALISWALAHYELLWPLVKLVLGAAVIFGVLPMIIDVVRTKYKREDIMAVISMTAVVSVILVVPVLRTIMFWVFCVLFVVALVAIVVTFIICERKYRTIPS